MIPRSSPSPTKTQVAFDHAQAGRTEQALAAYAELGDDDPVATAMIRRLRG